MMNADETPPQKNSSSETNLLKHSQPLAGGRRRIKLFKSLDPLENLPSLLTKTFGMIAASENGDKNVN